MDQFELLVRSRSKAARDAAFHEFVAEFEDRLYSYLVRRLRQRACDAQDALQETLYAIYRSLDGFQGDAQGFEKWVYSIARNRAREVERARQHAHAELGDDNKGEESPRSESAGPAAAADHDDSMERLRELLSSHLDRLPASQAEAIRRIYLQGCDFEQASRSLGVTQGACAMRVHRGLQKLREFRELQRFADESMSDPSSRIQA